MVKHSNMHTNKVRKRQHSGGSERRQQHAAADKQYTWKRPMVWPTIIKSVFGVFGKVQCNRPNLQIIRPNCGR